MTFKQFSLPTLSLVLVQNLVLSATDFQNLKVIRYTIKGSVTGNDSQYLLGDEADSLDRPKVEVTDDFLQQLRTAEDAGHRGRVHDLWK